MPNYNPLMPDAVKARWATDTTGETTTKTFRIEIDMLQWLESLDGKKAMGTHVRQALRDYKEKIENSLA
jgi:hypothetical protein